MDLRLSLALDLKCRRRLARSYASVPPLAISLVNRWLPGCRGSSLELLRCSPYQRIHDVVPASRGQHVSQHRAITNATHGRRWERRAGSWRGQCLQLGGRRLQPQAGVDASIQGAPMLVEQLHDLHVGGGSFFVVGGGKETTTSSSCCIDGTSCEASEFKTATGRPPPAWARRGDRRGCRRDAEANPRRERDWVGSGDSPDPRVDEITRGCYAGIAKRGLNNFFEACKAWPI